MNTNELDKQEESVELNEVQSFLSPYEQNRIKAKYEKSSFEEIFSDLKSNKTDAILYIMDKYAPLFYAIYKKREGPSSASQERELSYEDWLNEVFVYLSGSGISKPFYHVFSPKTANPTNEDLWNVFGYYLKNYLIRYFNRLMTAAKKDKSLGTSVSLNTPVVQTSEPDAPTIADTVTAANPEQHTADVREEEYRNIERLFEKFIYSLKMYKEKNVSKGKNLYEVLALRAKNKTIEEIVAITGLQRWNVYKTLSRGKQKWLKFLKAHNMGGGATAVLDTPEQE